ncbi:MAG TPA: sulfotransferase [Acidimicrobiia bacterium]|nr:sulfotransferase [Acidimicrobiia bacterium]
MTDSPILITGADRSGTSLMYALLGSHPDVAMIRRSNVWRWFDGAFGPLDQPRNLERCLDQVMRYQRMAVLEPDPDRIRRDFAAGEPTYGRLFALVFRHHADRLGRERWGDKSLHTEHHADRVFEEWPEAKVIHMVRDPRDRHASVIKRYPDQSKGIGAITGRWIESVDVGRRNLDRFGDHYLIVRYETLAERPVDTLVSVCRFLALPFDEAMLSMDGVPEQSEEGGNSSFGRLAPGTISARSIGRFAEVLDSKTIALIESLTGERMAEHDYVESQPVLDFAERLSLRAVALPLAHLRVRGWRRRAAGRDVGRGVPANRLTPQLSDFAIGARGNEAQDSEK